MGLDGIPPIVLSKCVSVQYRPFQYIFSLTLKYGYLLMDWKIHNMIPVFKSRVPIQVKNYWPFSLLCNIPKVLKKMIYYNKPINHVYCQINPGQFGFMQKLIYNTIADVLVQCIYCPSSAGYRGLIIMASHRKFSGQNT